MKCGFIKAMIWCGSVAIGLGGPVASFGQDQPLSVQAAVSSRDVFVGEPFQLQIQVSGSENPAEPDLSDVDGFSIQKAGGGQNSRRSVRIVNGQVSESVHYGYVFNYNLTAREAGRLTLPPITVHAEGRTAVTQPITVEARIPRETEDFKLRLSLSKNRVYVGEPVTLTVTWYLRRDVRGFTVSLPLLKRTDRFHFADREIHTRNDRNYYRIPFEQGEVIGEKGRGQLEGTEYATITFHKILIPKKPGTITVGPATVVCEALVGYRNSQDRFGRPSGDDFFPDFFFDGGQRGVYKKEVVPSNELTLRILDLPQDGRPANFAGHVGEYSVAATANPVDVNVGDPITLTVVLSGPEYLDHVALPPLNEQDALARDFKLPAERAEGKTAGGAKVFTQTIRAQHAGVTAIPPIELPFFDTAREAYRVARSDPIPLIVKATRVVTADDAEGRISTSAAASLLEIQAGGIAANYEDDRALKNQHYGLLEWLSSPPWLALVSIPPAAYLILLAVTIMLRKRNADPAAGRRRKAYRIFKRRLSTVNESDPDWDALLDALKTYLRDRLRLPAGALTFDDVKKELVTATVDADTIEALGGIYRQCEAGRYAGAASVSSADHPVDAIVSVIDKLERTLK